MRLTLIVSRGERLGWGTPWQGFLSPTATGACGLETLTFPLTPHSLRQTSDGDLASSTGLLVGGCRLCCPLNTCLLALMLVHPSLSSANEGLRLELDPPPSDTYNQGFRDLSLRASRLSAP